MDLYSKTNLAGSRRHVGARSCKVSPCFLPAVAMQKGVGSRFDRSRSGQVMIEACLGLAMLALVWILATYSTYMANNNVRASMAARHAAWLQGNGGEPSNEDIEEAFFFQKGLTQVQVGQGQGIAGLLSDSDKQTWGEAGNGPFVASVRFGIEPGDVAGATEFPFTLMKTQLPFMPASLLEDFLSVESKCQWDEVGDSWTDGVDALSEIFDMLKKELTDLI